jgi:DNA repair ATPase RecN
VTKHEVDGRTVSVAQPVVKAERVTEVARMLSGTPSDSARKHAKELLANAARDRGR